MASSGPLVDPETCKMAIENKFDLIKQLSTVAQGEVKPSELPSSCPSTHLLSSAFPPYDPLTDPGL